MRCVTHRLDAGAIAEIMIELAQCQVGMRTPLPRQPRSARGIVIWAVAEQRAVDAENRKVILAQALALATTAEDKALIARISKSIEKLHDGPRLRLRTAATPTSWSASSSHG